MKTSSPQPSKKGAEQNYPLPYYARTGTQSEDVRVNISRELFFMEKDDRFTRIFNGICLYAQTYKNALIRFKNLFDFLLKKGNTGINVEIRLRSALIDMVEALVKNGYAIKMGQAAQGKEPDYFILRDPEIDRVNDWISKFYGVDKSPAGNFTEMFKLNSMPTPELAKRAFKGGNQDKFIGMWREVPADGFTESTLDELSLSNQSAMVYLENGTKEAVSILISSRITYHNLVRLLLRFLVDLHQKNGKFQEELRSVFTHKEGTRGNYESLIQASQGFDGEYLDEQYNWVRMVFEFVHQGDFSERPEIFLNNKDLIVRDEVGHNHAPLVMQASALCFQMFLNHQSMIREKDRQKNEVINDKKLMIHALIEKSRKMIQMYDPDKGSFSEAVYFPVSAQMITHIKDPIKNMSMAAKYGEPKTLRILMGESSDPFPLIIRLVVEGQTYFIHRWRIKDVVYSIVSQERNRLRKLILNSWLKLPRSDWPKKKDFKVSESMLEPLSREILAYAYKMIDVYPDLEVLRKMIFPMPEDIAAYYLSKSDLVPPSSGNAYSDEANTPDQKTRYFKELLYEESHGVSHLPLEKVLAIEYEDMLAVAKQYKAKKKDSVEVDGHEFDSELDASMYSMLNNIIEWFFGLFGLAAKKSASGKSATGKKSAGSEALKMSLKAAGKKFSMPTNRDALRGKLRTSLKEWNQIFIDPKMHHPNWSRLSVTEREKLKKKYEEEARERMRDSQLRVDKAIKKAYSKFDLKGISNERLNAIAERAARGFNAKQVGSLTQYVKESIVLINTKD